MVLNTSIIKMLETVSVPYRGATFLNYLAGHVLLSFFMFPSPIGELHFSIEHERAVDEIIDSFRPLSGSYISQCNLQKSIIKEHSSVSVPYRGATFLNFLLFSLEQLYISFRPLSGSYISQSHVPTSVL